MRKPKFPRGCMVLAIPHWGKEPQRAVVEGTYAELYCGQNVTDYSLLFEHRGGQSWFRESELTFVKDNALEEWREWGLKRLRDDD